MSSIVSEEQESGSSSSSSSAAAHEDGPTVLEDEIFGSDLDESEEGSQLAGRRSDEEGSGREDAAKTKARTPSRSRKGRKPAKGGSKVSDRVMEARRDFDAALEKLKSQGNRRKAGYEPTDPFDLDEMAASLRRKMTNAVEADNESVQAGRPALAKHKMLPEVEELLNKKHMHEVLLDAGILSAVRLWLEPLPNRSLPAVHLRKTLLELIRFLPVEIDHLRESHIGRIVMYFARRPRETPEIQRLAKDLIARWSRPIIGDISFARSENEDKVHGTDDASSSGTATMLQSPAFRQMTKGYGAAGAVGMSVQQRKLVMHMQKKSRSKKA